MSYFAVFVPGVGTTEKGTGDNLDTPFVYEDMTQTLEVMKKYKEKNPRFKHFSSFEDARHFSTFGGNEISADQENQEIDYFAGGDRRPPTPRPAPSNSAEEAPRPFPAPTRPELTDLKKAIESKNIDKVRHLVDSNPRYLINCSGDTPTILQEGYRYNALHVAARVGHLDTVKIVLERFKDESSEYVRRLYPDDKNDDVTANRRRLLLDFYLNTPDKGFNQTPLHFAVKNGFVDVAKYLCSFDECQRDLVDKNGQTPKDLAEESDRATPKAKKEILRCLEHGVPSYFIPLYRVRDEVYAPVLRHPAVGFPEAKLELDVNKGLRGVEFQLAAYIGPIDDAEVAEKLHSQWASGDDGPNAKIGDATPTRKSTRSESKAAAAVKRSDLHKGMEQIGRRVASSGGYGWSENWIFLQTFADLRTEDGLKLLEKYFRHKAAKEKETFEELLGTKLGEISPGRDDCRKKLDFSNVRDDHDDPSDESSKDSSDLYFDADDSGDSVIKASSDSDTSGQDESRDGYFTPPQELTANVILGKEPTKLDRDVYSTLESVAIDENRFPYTVAWMKMVRDFSDEERRRWAPYDSPRSRKEIRQKFLQLRASE